jgi:hypothetical protein
MLPIESGMRMSRTMQPGQSTLAAFLLKHKLQERFTN